MIYPNLEKALSELGDLLDADRCLQGLDQRIYVDGIMIYRAGKGTPFYFWYSDKRVPMQNVPTWTKVKFCALIAELISRNLGNDYLELLSAYLIPQPKELSQ